MTFTVGWGSICGLLTVIVWAVSLFWPCRRSGSPYDFGAMFEGMLQAFATVVTTLLIWLVYFAVLR